MDGNNAGWYPSFTNPAIQPSLAVGSRTMVAPIEPILGSLTNTNLTAAQYGAVVALQALQGGPAYVVPPPGTVIATFVGSDLTPWDGTQTAAKTTNLPSIPNRAFPVSGMPFPDGFNTSTYMTFVVPGNLGATGVAVKLGLVVDPNPLNVDPSGASAAFGVAVAALGTGSSTVDDTALPADNIASVGPLPTIPGTFVQMTIPANGTLSPGNLHLVRVTRRTDSVLDRNVGRLLLISLSIITA